jgi:hypothetical protein
MNNKTYPFILQKNVPYPGSGKISSSIRISDPEGIKAPDPGSGIHNIFMKQRMAIPQKKHTGNS